MLVFIYVFDFIYDEIKKTKNRKKTKKMCVILAQTI